MQTYMMGYTQDADDDGKAWAQMAHAKLSLALMRMKHSHARSTLGLAMQSEHALFDEALAPMQTAGMEESTTHFEWWWSAVWHAALVVVNRLDNPGDDARGTDMYDATIASFRAMRYALDEGTTDSNGRVRMRYIVSVEQYVRGENTHARSNGKARTGMSVYADSAMAAIALAVTEYKAGTLPYVINPIYVRDYSYRADEQAREAQSIDCTYEYMFNADRRMIVVDTWLIEQICSPYADAYDDRMIEWDTFPTSTRLNVHSLTWLDEQTVETI